MGLWKDKIRKHWCYSFQYQSTPYAGRGYKTKREASAAREERRKEIKNQPIKTGMAYSETVNLYLDHSKRRFATGTYEYKKYVYGQFYSFLKETDLLMHEITTAMIKAYLDTRHSNNNFNVNRRELSALFTYSKDILEIIEKNPVLKVGKMPHTVKEKYIPPMDDVEKIIHAADPKTDEQDLLIVLIHTVARIDEVLRLRWRDINFEKKILIKRTRKTQDGSWKKIPIKINQTLEQTLKKMHTIRLQDKWVFFNKRMKNRYYKRPKFMHGLCKRAGVEPAFSFHCFRHLMASLMNSNPNIPIKAIQMSLGHGMQTTTEVYLHELDNSVAFAMDSISEIFVP